MTESKTERPFVTLSSAVVWSCPWYSIRQDTIRRPDGSVGEYNTVEKPDAVWIVPVTGEGQIIMLHHYRYTIKQWCWEIPAGSVKPGQSLEEAAREELREEVGGHTQRLTYIAPYFMANGICNERGHFFLARDVSLGASAHEPAEVMEIHAFDLESVQRMLSRHEVTDAPSALALHLCLPHLR